MEGIIFIGLQASGKSTFYKEHFFNTHMRISMDLFNTRNKEKQFLAKAIELHQRVVIDNTNPTLEDRQRYIPILQQNKYRIIGYYFESQIEACLERNAKRLGKERIPDAGIYATARKMLKPSLDEGFDELFHVSIRNSSFVIRKWN